MVIRVLMEAADAGAKTPAELTSMAVRWLPFASPKAAARRRQGRVRPCRVAQRGLT
jgi:hypothetical protein